MDRTLDRRAHAAEHPDVVREVAALLAARWDPDAELAAPDGARAPTSHASAVLAIYAAGGSPAEVMGYLRRAEEARFVFPRSTGEARAALAQAVLDVVLAHPAGGRRPAGGRER
jgi:hypothetical protein